MSVGGAAAEQVIRLSLDGISVIAKITGALAKELAIMLLAALKDQNKNKVKGRYLFLGNMLKHNRQTQIVSIKQTDLKAFVQGAKRYGIVYCVLRKSRNNLGECEVMIRPEDVSKVNRIVENIKVATVDLSPERQMDGPEMHQTEPATDEQLLDMLLGPEEAAENPSPALTEQGSPSAPSSMTSSNIGEVADERPSVREALKEIRREQRAERPEAVQERPNAAKNRSNQHSKVKNSNRTGQQKGPSAPKKGGAR